MSTKVAEACPKCGHAQMPTDEGTNGRRYFYVKGIFPMWLWRFTCEGCGWTWANPLQRKHNEHEYNKAYNIAHGKTGRWFS